MILQYVANATLHPIYTNLSASIIVRIPILSLGINAKVINSFMNKYVKSLFKAAQKAVLHVLRLYLAKRVAKDTGN